MQSFSSDGEEDKDKELIHVQNEETSDKTISLHKSELDSYEND